MKKAALVVGGNAAGVQAALDLADSRLEVYLVERSLTLGAQELARCGPTSTPLSLLTPRLLAAANHPNIHLLTNAEVVAIDGVEGDFSVSIRKYPRFVLENRCTGCGRCERDCPVALEHGLNSTSRAIHLPNLRAIPYVFGVDKNGTSPCRLACPGKINAHGYVALISQGRFADALRLILEAVPLPGVLGRVCNRPCESACNRREFDDPVAICYLKRFVADRAWDQMEHPLGSKDVCSALPETRNRRKVAIVGSGPAGLSAAWMLVRKGYAVTVFESMPVPGGMLSTCIPEFRLPRNIVQREIDYIRSLGVEILTSVTVGRDISLDQIKDQGFEAVFLAIGAHRPRSLGIPGESLPGVVDCISLLKDVSQGRRRAIGKRVLVVGGGNAAIDAARTAIRLKARRVTILYRRSRADMLASEEEIREAEKEGVEILPLVAPKRILGEGKVTGVECLRCRLEGRDSGGRGRPVLVPGSEFVVDADAVILAIGLETDFSLLPASLQPTSGATVIAADAHTLATRIPGVFAGGDAVVGASTVIEAIASGKQAAESIDRYLRGEQVPTDARAELTPAKIDPESVRARKLRRQAMPSLSPRERVRSFDEVDLGLSAEMAIREAERCLNCAGCSECMQCVRACELDALVHSETTQTFDVPVASIVLADESGVLSRDREIGIQFTTAGAIIETLEPPVDNLEASASVRLGKTGQTKPRTNRFSASRLEYQPFLRGSAAAAKAMASLAKYRPSPRAPVPDLIEPPPVAATGRLPSPGKGLQVLEFGNPLRLPETEIPVDGHRRVGVFLCECGGQISEKVSFKDVEWFCRKLPGVAHVQTVRYACSGTYKEAILRECESKRLTLGIVAACACCSLDQICYACTHTKIRCKNGLLSDGSVRFEFVNIREQCAFVHSDSLPSATEKASALIAATLVRYAPSEVARPTVLPVVPAAVIFGGGPASVEAASRISAQGFETHLVSKMTASELASRGLDLQRITLHPQASPVGVVGVVGSFEVSLNRNGTVGTLRAGVLIMDGGSLDEVVIGRIGDSLEATSDGAVSWLDPGLSTGLLPPETKVPGIFYCPPTGSVPQALTLGAAAASKASILMGAGEYRTSSIVATVSEDRCRWCGECEKACAFSAIRVVGSGTGGRRAKVDLVRCRGCGNCVPRCSTRAISLTACSMGSRGSAGGGIEAPQLAAAELVRREDEGFSVSPGAPSAARQPRILVLTCNWEAYAAIEAAGASRQDYPTSFRVLRLSCLGRTSSSLIVDVFRAGADGVMLLACPEDKCHFESGSALAEKSFKEAAQLLEAAGIPSDRLEFHRLGSPSASARSDNQVARKLKAFERRLTGMVRQNGLGGHR